MKRILCIITFLAVILNNFDVSYACVLKESELEATTTTEEDSTAQTNADAAADSSTDESGLDLQSRSAVLMEVKSGKIIYEKNADEQLRPASVTKVMTLLLIFEEIEKGNMSYDDIVTVTEHAASMGGSQCFFEAGEQQTVRDMIKCIEVASGNDAAVAMAEHIAGSEAAFVVMMNERAKELGMNNSHFENACGLEAEGHLTTARDIAIMSRELMANHPEIKEFSTIWMDSIIHKTARGESQFDLANTNKFLRQYTGATGLKTGYTSQAKYCMVASAERNGGELIASIMGSETKEIRNSEAGKLLDYGYAKCKIYTDANVLPEDFKIEVKSGTQKYVSFNPIQQNEIVLVDGNPDAVEKEIIIHDKLEAPIYNGDSIGVVQYSYEGTLVDELIIYASEDVEKMSMGYSFRDLCARLFMLK